MRRDAVASTLCVQTSLGPPEPWPCISPSGTSGVFRERLPANVAESFGRPSGEAVVALSSCGDAGHAMSAKLLMGSR